MEDNSGRGDKPLYELELAAERIRAAKAGIGDRDFRNIPPLQLSEVIA